MNLYHSRLTQDDLNELIIRYKIPRDLHPRLPSKEFVMSDLPDDAIGVYHCIFDFSSVWIPFSSFLLALIKHYKTLCKQGHWFSVAKRRASSLVCIDDNCSYMKRWKSGFFLIDWRAIPDYMSWRHSDSAINDLKPPASSFNMEDVRRLSAHVVKLKDMPEGVLVFRDGTLMCIYDFLCLPEWTGAEVQEEPHHDIRPTLQRLPFYYTPHAAIDAAVPDPTQEDLAVGNPSAKVVAKAEASQKRKASTFGATSSHVAKHIRPALAQSSGSTTRPNLFAKNSDDESDDDNACVKNPLITLTDKGIMTDAAATSSAGVNRPRPSSGLASTFKYFSEDAIHKDFFPFSPRPYYATYPEGGVAKNYAFNYKEWDAPHQPTLMILTKEVFKDPSVFKTMVDQFLTPGEMVWIKALSSDQLTAKMSVLHCLMMLHGGELLARYSGLLQSHHVYVQLTYSRLKGYQERFASLTGLESQVSGLQRHVVGLNDKLSSSNAAFAKSKAKGNGRKKKIKSLTKSLDQLNAEVARLSTALNQATILEAEKDEEILRLRASPPEFVSFFRGQFQGLVQKFLTSDEFSRVQGELLSLAVSAGFERGLGMHQTLEEFAEESTVTPVFSSLEFLSNTIPSSSATLLEPNEEWVNAMVDGSDHGMTGDVDNGNPGSVFVQGASHVVDGNAELTLVGSERVSSGPNDVVVALSIGEKGDGSLPSSVTDEEAVATPSGV
ncbi:hypothetical protein Tco_1162970 [Tanacetum coccineum]